MVQGELGGSEEIVGSMGNRLVQVRGSRVVQGLAGVCLFIFLRGRLCERAYLAYLRSLLGIHIQSGGPGTAWVCLFREDICVCEGVSMESPRHPQSPRPTHCYNCYGSESMRPIAPTPL